MKSTRLCFAIVSLSVFGCLLVSQAHAQTGFAINKNAETAKKAEDGLSFANAIIITENSELKGLNAENKWIKEHYPNCKLKMQTLSIHQNKPYDVISIVLVDNTEVKLYFNIESFYDKL